MANPSNQWESKTQWLGLRIKHPNKFPYLTERVIIPSKSSWKINVEENKNYDSKMYTYPKFIATFITTAKIWKHPNWMDKEAVEYT